MTTRIISVDNVHKSYLMGKEAVPALRKALVRFYPEVKNVHLVDYKVRVLNERNGTAAKVRVLVESGDEEKTWSTVGVSHDIIEASLQALNDSLNYEILKVHNQPVVEEAVNY